MLMVARANPAKHIYRIYSINRPGRLLNFWTLRVGTYWRWALIRGWALINFFSLSDGCLFEVSANSRLGAYSNKINTVTINAIGLQYALRVVISTPSRSVMS